MFFPYSDDIQAKRPPIVTVGIIALNVASLLYVASLPPHRQFEIVAMHGFVPKRIGQLTNPALPVRVQFEPDRVAPTWPFGEHVLVRGRGLELPPDPLQIFASLFTSIFLHAGWLHLLGNMWFLWLFGNNVEDHLGHVGFTMFYLVGGILASSCHWYMDPGSATPVVGASGAVAAVLGAYAVTFPFARIRCLIVLIIFITSIELPALVFLGIWFLEQLLEGVGAIQLGLSGGVAWWAHVGGFIAGAIIMPLWDSNRTVRYPRPGAGVGTRDPIVLHEDSRWGD